MQDTGKIAVRPLAGGLNKNASPVLLRDGETPDCENVDYNRNSIASHGGAIKFGNRSAPRAALRTKVDRGNSPLTIRTDSSGNGYSVPLRGYGWLRYRREYDIGGDFAELSATSMHTRRGRSFERHVTFQVPPEEKFAKEFISGSAGAATNFLSRNVFLDECFIVWQKGGNGLHPMSWALAVVNVGSPEVWNTLFPSNPFTQRTSTYALCWIWLDMAEWTNIGISAMRYKLTNGDASTGDYATGAWRAVVVEKFIEPGKTYSVSVALSLDSGSIGTPAAPTTSWNNDGSFTIRVSEDGGPVETFSFTDDSGGGVASGMAVWKGPQDSMRYFAKYGVRMSMKSREYLGLGHRFHPHNGVGWIPFGIDSAALEKGGYSMLDHAALGATERDAIYLTTTTHAGVDPYVTVPNQYIVTGIGRDGMRTPIGPWNGTPPVATSWNGLGFGGTIFNTEALRGYRLIQYGDASAAIKGGILNIESYSEAGASYRLTVTGGASLGAWVTDKCVIQAFRWNQRPLVISECRMYSQPITWTDRTSWSFTHQLDIADTSEPGIEYLVAYWPLDDGEGGVLREVVNGFDGYTAPFTLPTGKRGTRGDGQLALSGEGEALVLDLSENPIVKRELLKDLKDGKGGFAIEVTMILPEATYVVPDDDPESSTANDFIGRYGSAIASWEIKDPQTDGFTTEPKPLMVLSHRIKTTSGLLTAYRNPVGFRLEVAQASDQLDTVMTTAVAGADDSPTNAPWDVLNTPWVGETITLQFGIEPTAVADTYRAYVAATPKKLLKPAAGDISDGEFAYYASLAIAKRDIERTIITIGGMHKPRTFSTPADNYGYSELNCNVILDEVRVFGTPAPGALPASSGGVITDRSGKIQGFNSLPARALDAEDILLDLGPAVKTANVTDGSVSVTSPGQATFFQGDPAATVESARGSYLLVSGDVHQTLAEETTGDEQEEFYYVSSVSSDGRTLTLSTPYSGETKSNASASLFKLIGYTAFADDIFGRGLTLGSGSTFKPGTTLTSDATFTSDLFFNHAPVTGNWKVRVYSPLSSASGADIAPSWVGGLLECRRNPILGTHAQNERVFVGAGSCVFIADDRWRFLEVSHQKTTWLQFLTQPVGKDAISAPLVQDRVEFTSTTNVDLSTSTMEASGASRGRVWDVEVWLDDVRGVQTILWCGSATSDPLKNAGTGTNDHRMNHWLRIVDGRPELVVGCSSNYSGGAAPPAQGLYAITSKKSIRAGERTHIRWAVAEEDTTNHWLYKPSLWINGKPIDTVSDTVETGATGNEWINVSDIASVGSNARIYLGTARDAYEENEPQRTFTANTIPGMVTRPSLLRGYLHTLRGKMRNLVVGYDTNANVQALGAFNPDAISYATTFTKVMDVAMDEGVGHKVYDSAGARYGLVWSNPFICVFAEMGLRDNLYSFANFDDRVYATNGGRPMVWSPSFGGRFAGVMPPNTTPDFTIDRKGLWKTNKSGGTGVTDQTPVGQAANSTENPILHFSNYGNNYLSQVFHKEMTWEKGDTLHFKCLVNMRDTSGRIPLFSTRTSIRNGSLFCEIRDGRLVIGWYDTLLKEEQTVTTSAPVFTPNSWHYVDISKRFPQADSLGTNWDDSFPSQTIASATANEGPWLQTTLTAVATAYTDGQTINSTAGGETAYVMKAFPKDTTANTQVIQYRMTSNNATLGAGAATSTPVGSTGTVPATESPLMRDRAIVRRFAKSSTRETEWDAKTDGTTRNCVSFTTAASPTGCTATGLVTIATRTYTVNAGGTVTASAATFVPDHVGMFFQFGAGTNSAKLWRVASYVGATQVTLVLSDGTAFGAAGGVADAVGRLGGVFIGVSLIRSTNFSTSKNPDDAVYDIEAFGSQLAGNPQNGIAPFNGEFDSFGWTSTSSHDAFRAAAVDPNETGTDTFAGPIYNSTAPGALDFDSGGNNFAVVHELASPQTSTQPNEDLEVAMSANASANADDLKWRSTQTIQTLDGTRRIRVTFIDTEQNEESNPSPELLVTASAEDLSNPSGAAAILLSGIPISADKGTIWRRIYMSLVDGATPLLVGTIPDNTSTSFSIFKSESEIARGPAVNFSNFPPPRCNVVATSQRSVFYGAVEGQRDAVQYSQAYRPGQVPYGNFLIFNTGDNSPITGLADLQGRLVVFKRNSIFQVRVDTGVAIQDIITSGAGSVNHASITALDDQIYFLDPRGPCVLPTQGEPVYLGNRLEPYFQGEADPLSEKRAYGAICRKRGQYVFLSRDDGNPYMNRRFSVEYDDTLVGSGVGGKISGFRFSSYRGPNLTALSSVSNKAGGTDVVVAGTEEGYVVWLDRGDTRLSMLGPDSGAWGSSSITATANGSSAMVLYSGTVDTSFSGPRGTTIRWLDANSVEQSAVVLFATATTIYFDRPVSSPPLLTAPTLILGAQRPRWKSKVFDAGVTYAQKRSYYLDVTRTPSSGNLLVSTYKDFSSTPLDRDKLLNLAVGYGHIATQIKGDFIQVGFTEPFASAGTSFEITDLVLRLDQTDPH